MEQRTATTKEYQRCVNIVVEYINNHLGEEIDLEVLAGISHFSPYHFHRIMKAFLGEPIGTYIMRTRIETAARLLRYSTMPVSDIAYRIGYGTPSSLSKGFKQFYGISPNDYRNNKDYVIMKPESVKTDLNLGVEVVDLLPRQVIYIRLLGDYKENDYCAAMLRLYRFAGEHQLTVSDPCPLCIYHDDPKVTSPENLRTDVCLVVSEPATAQGEVGFKEVQGGRYAAFLYKGSYDNLCSVYDTIYGKYIQEYTLRDAPAYERYLNDPRDTAPEDLLTEISVPVE